MNKNLALVIVVGILISLLPIIVNIIDNHLYRIEYSKPIETTTPTTTPTSTREVIVLKDSVSSSTGEDTLIASPGAVWVLYGGVFKLTIKVLFKHSQPCPFSDRSLNYSFSGGFRNC